MKNFLHKLQLDNPAEAGALVCLLFFCAGFIWMCVDLWHGVENFTALWFAIGGQVIGAVFFIASITGRRKG